MTATEDVRFSLVVGRAGRHGWDDRHSANRVILWPADDFSACGKCIGSPDGVKGAQSLQMVYPNCWLPGLPKTGTSVIIGKG